MSRKELADELAFLVRLLRTQRPLEGEVQAEHDRDLIATVAERLAILASNIQGEG